jgi:hypothetical protein
MRRQPTPRVFFSCRTRAAPMHHFTYRDGRLHAEDVDVTALADKVGTPFYVYSTATLERHYTLFARAVGAPRNRVFYAMKANSNLAVLQTLGRLGAGADTVSEGEIRKAMAAGIPADRIVFSGVGKADHELAHAVDVSPASPPRRASARAQFSGSIQISAPAATPKSRRAARRTNSASA